MDCGPHCRSYGHLASWAKTWFVDLGCEIILQFFIEKHGKGIVEGLFGMVRAWIRDYLMTTKKRIIEVDDLMAVLRGGAQTAMSGTREVQGIWWSDLSPKRSHPQFGEWKIRSSK